MRLKRICLTILLFPSVTWANLDLITWKGIYYQAVPIKKEVTQDYCNAHTPGTFIHTIKDTFALTNKGIKLDHTNFNIDKVDNIYLIHGDFVASGQLGNKPWHDHIFYNLYKLSEAGTTKGVWYTSECKGLYKGIAIRNKNT
ncbi:MAG: hypothetical protein ABI597_00965 [Gammaproteobacteria bacterium]